MGEPAIRILRPRLDEYTYEAVGKGAGTHPPDSCGCLSCADSRAAAGDPPLETELAYRARLARARLALLAEDESDSEAWPALLAFVVGAVLVVAFWGGVLYLIARFAR